MVPTPGAHTIEDLARFLGVPTSKTAKVVLYTDQDGKVIMAVIRGDLDVNEVKLAHAAKATEMHAATDAELQAAGVVAGYASPIGQTKVRVIVDDSIVGAANLVAGANRVDHHFLNVNYPRDFRADTVADIALARHGDACGVCGSPLTEQRGIELGHIFKLGTKYSDSMGATYLDADGQKRPIVMGCYGIGVGRLLAAVIEQHHDERGIVWPPAVAPLGVHIVALSVDNEDVRRTAEALEGVLGKRWGALYDDRSEASAGVKFNDADLIGLPVRVTVSPRSLKAGGVEVRARWAGEAEVVAVDEVESAVEQAMLTWPGPQ